MRDAFHPCTYILVSHRGGTLYIGVTSNLLQRMWQHRNGATKGFAGRHRIYRLVHFEFFGTMALAIAREKQLKNWHRAWKINLIEAANPEWRDLAFDIGAGPVGRAMDAETSSA
ncbi:GIY-YIG nuclease family protein [Sphingopyxis sp. 2PD]|uniref:GIY-YIG nuclease family protein n=1 Tax=Sphingopyxis sp. 2PD TaxID=2502196 RepID=UPI0010F675E0|nr:GIY-YIG nuclease family protein [Sphingopyxis sp. 2PD]